VTRRRWATGARLHPDAALCIVSRRAEYATLAHECTHWTAINHGLTVISGASCFADEGYAGEVLVAELGAAFLCADL
jgi:antirestriction protein ArdC